jgi:DNA-binding NtrC family response regulator
MPSICIGNSIEPFSVALDGELEALGVHLPGQISRFERALIEAELRKHDGDVPAASDALGVPMKTLYDKLHRLKISSTKHRV